MRCWSLTWENFGERGCLTRDRRNMHCSKEKERKERNYLHWDKPPFVCHCGSFAVGPKWSLTRASEYLFWPCSLHQILGADRHRNKHLPPNPLTLFFCEKNLAWDPFALSSRMVPRMIPYPLQPRVSRLDRAKVPCSATHPHTSEKPPIQITPKVITTKGPGPRVAKMGKSLTP